MFLTSLVFEGLGDWLDRRGCSGTVPVISNASRELADRHAIVDMAAGALAAAGRQPLPLDVLADGVGMLERADALVISGGDPFRLLADLRHAGADRLITAAAARGAAIAGQSAGAIVLGPDLRPTTLTSPFAPPPGLELTGLNLTRRLVLPHHGRPGRNAAHRRAALQHAPTLNLIALWDDEVLLDGDDWQIHRGGVLTRPARASDAAAVAEVFHQAALAAWATFLPGDRLQAADRDEPAWEARIREAGEDFLVAEDAGGVLAFVHIRATAEPAVGELNLLYTHPRCWGSGIGRRLLERATWMLLCRGHREAVLWTEARNHRALAVYRASGWSPDGAVDERTYLNTPIRNLRHRLTLADHAGGP